MMHSKTTILAAVLSVAIVTTANVFGTAVFSDNFDDGVLHPKWHVLQNGCAIEEAGGELRVHGTVLESGWGKGNGIYTYDEFPEGDFTVAVDFQVPQFSGLGTRLVYLQAHSWEETIGWE